MFFFEGNILEEVNEYKYLRIDFNNKLNLEHCRKKGILGGWKIYVERQNYGIRKQLYGCELWASSNPV